MVLIVAFSVSSFFQGFVSTFTMLLSLRLLMGAFEGPIIPVTQSVLALESSERRRGFNLGFTMNTANGLFGSILAPLVIVALATAFDWRTAFFFTVLPGLVIALFVFKLMREPEFSAERQAEETITKAERKERFLAVLKNRNIILSIVMFSGFMVYLIALQVFAPVYLTGVKGLTPTTMSYIMAAFGLGTAVWGFVVPMISDRIGRKPTAIVSDSYRCWLR